MLPIIIPKKEFLVPGFLQEWENFPFNSQPGILKSFLWIQCPYHVHLECQVRCYVIQDAAFKNQDAVFISQDVVFINQEVRRQPLIKAIFEGDWTRIMAAKTEEFFEGSVPLSPQCGLCCQENSDDGYGKPNGAKFKRNIAMTINISDHI